MDTLSLRQSPILRRISDINQNVSGTKVNILRITRVVKPNIKQTNTRFPAHSVFGDFKEELHSHVISNCIINYPFSNIESFALKELDDTGKIDSSISGIDINEILPVKLIMAFENKTNDVDLEPIKLIRGDKLVDVIFSDNEQKGLPIILEVSKQYTGLLGKHEITRSADLSIHRGKLNPEITKLIDDYVNSVVEEKKTERSQRF